MADHEIPWLEWRKEFSKHNNADIVKHVDAIGEVAKEFFDLKYWQRPKHKTMLISCPTASGTIDILDFYGDISLKSWHGCAFLFRDQRGKSEAINNALNRFYDRFDESTESTYWMPTDFALEEIRTGLSKLADSLYAILRR